MAKEKGFVRRAIGALTSPFRRASTPEPTMPLYSSGIQEPVILQGITLPALYAVTDENLILRTVVTTLAQEMFRRGHYFEKKFFKKCKDCNHEFQHDVEICTLCDGEVRDPDPDQLIYARWLLEQDNSMEQSFADILREVERDLNVVDDAFLILVKDYYYDPLDEGKIAFQRIREMVRGDPIFTRIVADKRGVRGGRYRVCTEHRENVESFNSGIDTCQICDKKLEDVHYVNTAGQGKTQYYIEGEVIHISKYQPSRLYGRPPVQSLWRQAMTLTAMDNYLYTAYSKRRFPKGILSITTDNLESMKSFWKGVDEKMERDPHYIPKVGIESTSGRGGVNFVRFMDTLEEMQYISVRDEIRTRIASFYGVSPVFMNDTGKSGGLSNEGLQILVTNRAVEFGHKVYTKKLFPRLLKEMDITDWVLTLYPNEEEDEVTRLRRDEMAVNVAQRMMMIGFMPELKEDAEHDLKFFFRKPTEDEQQMGGGMPGGMPMGGMPGGMPMGGMPMGGMPMGAMGGGLPMGSQPGGEGQGIRNPRGPASPQQRTSQGSGSPVSNVQQRGPPLTRGERTSNSMQNAGRFRGA